MQAHLGQLAASGDPRRFVDGGLAPVSRIAKVFSGVPGRDGSSHVPAKQLTLVDRSKTYSHIDPLSASPDRNDFLETVVPFLRKVR